MGTYIYADVRATGFLAAGLCLLRGVPIAYLLPPVLSGLAPWPCQVGDGRRCLLDFIAGNPYRGNRGPAPACVGSSPVPVFQSVRLGLGFHAK